MQKIELCQLGYLSLYENVTSPTPIGSIGINVLHGLIERGGKNGKIQRGIEQLRSINDKEQRSKIKRELPVVTVSGTFAQRANAGITSHSGLLQIDIDYNGNEQLIDSHGGAGGVATLVSAYPHALITCVSPSGNGVKSIVRIELQSILKRLPIDLAAAHALAAEKVSADYLDLFGLIVDSAGSRMAQAMIIPFDPSAYYTPNATPATAEDSSIQAHIDMLANRAKAKATAASMAKARNGGTGIERYYYKAVDNALRDLDTAEQGTKHKTAVSVAMQLQSLISGAAMLGVNLHDCEGAFLSIYQLIGGTERKAADIWRWAQARTIEPRIPHDSTGYVGNVVSVSGAGAFRVLSAWQKSADNLLLTLENGVQVPANLCQVIGR